MKSTDKTSAELLAAQALSRQMKKELQENILPYWMKSICRPEGGFYGRISGMEETDVQAPVGGIMTARMLWTFASAYRLLGNEEYLEMARP